MSKKEILKEKLPRPFFKILSYINVYQKRVYTWLSIVVFVRGYTLKDEVKLLLSAFIGLFTSFKKLSEWKHPVLIWDSILNVQAIGMFKVRAKTDDLNHINPKREKEVYETIAKHLNEGDTFIDAGANIGFFTLLASRIVGENGKVFAIEMLPQNQKILQNHIALNDITNVKMINTALYHENDVRLIIEMPTNRYGMASVINKFNDQSLNIRINSSRLDKVLPDLKKIKLIKIDTEGAEKHVLLGSTKIIQKVEHIIFESYKNDENREFVFDFLGKNNFMISKIDDKDYLATNIRFND
jgi:FkbM family methyltransferase